MQQKRNFISLSILFLIVYISYVNASCANLQTNALQETCVRCYPTMYCTNEVLFCRRSICRVFDAIRSCTLEQTKFLTSADLQQIHNYAVQMQNDYRSHCENGFDGANCGTPFVTPKPGGSSSTENIARSVEGAYYPPPTFPFKTTSKPGWCVGPPKNSISSDSGSSSSATIIQTPSIFITLFFSILLSITFFL
eukprot:TRINITY_DN523_c1_g4_i1.p1 TRINITY_DN523_c1_g4~~TRINITY_DN523_c1_g4_i1.p1  ORF type:complete len:194 (+),score=83.93 TRINITY_DN523_c1_g4_i1:89-670(+)